MDVLGFLELRLLFLFFGDKSLLSALSDRRLGGGVQGLERNTFGFGRQEGTGCCSETPRAV